MSQIRTTHPDVTAVTPAGRRRVRRDPALRSIGTGAVLVPATASAAVDSDGDGLTDDFEIPNHLDPQNPDSDRDGLNDGDELHRYYTGPLNQDSDDDDISDGDEVKRYHTNPLVPNAKPPAPPSARHCHVGECRRPLHAPIPLSPSLPIAPGGCLAMSRATFTKLGGFGKFRELGLD